MGDINQFAVEFEEDLLVIDYAVKEFGLPNNLKLSIHSGSDKFSIYPVMGRLIKKYDKGIHVKTAGTTWLEELIGLIESGNEGYGFASVIYLRACLRREKIIPPYATVIDIDFTNLPEMDEVLEWDCKRFAEALRHVKTNPNYNSDMRQLMHIAFKIAADFGTDYTDLLKKYAEIIEKQVIENLWDRHIKLLFGI